MSEWMDDARARDLRVLIPSLTAGEAKGSRRRPGPCPACGGVDVSVWAARDRTHERWSCHRCMGTGDAVDAVSYALCGDRFGSAGCDTSAVREWFCGELGASVRTAPPPRPPEYPPRQEVMDLLSRCSAGGDGLAWIRGRGMVGDLPPGCLGTLPAYTDRRLTMPSWATCAGQDWQTTGHRYLVPLCDHTGSVVSVRARRSDGERGSPKGLPPAGYSVRGLWMASAWGRARLASSWTGDVVVVEGEPAWLLGVAHWEPRGVLVLGFFAGSCTLETAARLRGSKVLIAVDDDRAGLRYVQSWRDMTGERVASTTLKDSPSEWMT